MADFVSDEDGVHGHRRRRSRIHDRALRCDDRHTTVGAFVPRDRGVEERRQSHVGGGIRVGKGGVLEATDLWVTAGKVEGHSVALYRHGDAYRDVALLEAVVIGAVLAMIGAIG